MGDRRGLRRVATVAAVLLTLPTAVLASCGGNDPAENDSPDGGTDNTAQVANPASQYCVDQGGTIEIVDEAGGQVGYCTLPDGTRVEEWEYFRSANG